MASELRVNSSTNRSGLGTITYTDSGPIVSGVGTFTNGLTVDGTQTTVKSLKFTGDNYNANWFKTSNKLRFNDNAKATFGTADDLSIYHNGSDNYIDGNSNAEDHLYIRANVGADHSSNIHLQAKSGEESIVCRDDESVELYFNGNQKLRTTDTGVTVTGTLIADGLTLYDNEKLLIGNNTDIEVFHNGTNSIFQSDTGDLQINSGNSAGNVEINVNNNVSGNTRETSAKFIKNGGVELYYDNEKTAFTGQDALYIYGRTSNSGMIEVASNQGANNNDRFRIHKTSADQRLSIQNYASGSWVENIRMTAGGSVELKHSDGTTKMHTDTTGITVNSRITASGDTNTYINVGSSADTLEFYTGGSNVFKFDSSGRIVVNNGSAQDGAAKLQIKGGTAANILTADITNQTVAVFGGASPGTTQTGYGAGIVIKPIISRGSNFFLGACNSGSNQEGTGYFVIRQGHLAANTTERLRINENGQVEIQERLWVPGNKKISLGNTAASPHFSFYKDDATGVNHITSNSGAEIKVSSGNGDSNGIEFWDYTGGNKRCQIDGHGIKFNTDTAEANALNDYEQGTFSPAWFDDGGVFVSSYSVQYGQYTKIGNVVYFCFGLRIGSFSRTPNSGQACRVGNLPYVSRVVGDDQEPVFNLYARLWGSGTPPETAWLRQSSGGSGSNHVEFYMDESQTGNDHRLVGADFDTSATCRVIVNGFYYTTN